MTAGEHMMADGIAERAKRVGAAEERKRLADIIDGWLDAYPPDVFPPPDPREPHDDWKVERARVGAYMARHVLLCLAEDLEPEEES